MILKPNCPVCNNVVDHNFAGPNGSAGYACNRCGTFALGPFAAAKLEKAIRENAEARATTSHYIRLRQQDNQLVLVQDNELDPVINGPLPSPHTQGDNLIRWLGEKSSHPGDAIRLHDSKVGGFVGCANSENLLFILKGLVRSGYLEDALHITLDGSANCILTFEGWTRYDDLKRGRINSSTAFMAMKYGDSTLDQLVEKHFKQAVSETGYTLVRLDDNPKAGLIDDNLRIAIQSCRFLIADLSHSNNGAYWEAGYAEGLGKPVIYTCDKRKFDEHGTVHFDTNHHLTIVWDSNDIAAAMRNLKNTIRITIPEAIRNGVFD